MLVAEMQKRSLWAQGLAGEEFARVSAEVLTLELAEGGYVCRKGDDADMWFGVASGLVKMNTVSANGKSVTFTGLPAGSWFSEGTLLKREPRRYDIVALRTSVIAAMPLATFE